MSDVIDEEVLRIARANKAATTEFGGDDGGDMLFDGPDPVLCMVDMLVMSGVPFSLSYEAGPDVVRAQFEVGGRVVGDGDT